MRIRKHAKVSDQVYAAAPKDAERILQPHVCEVNQSAWDVVTFPSKSRSSLSQPQPLPPLVISDDDSHDGNGEGSFRGEHVQRDVKAKIPSSTATKWTHFEGSTSKNSNLSKKASVDTNTSTRPKRSTRSLPNNRPDFCYYSAFGPLWGIKRGPGRTGLNQASDDDVLDDEAQNVEAKAECGEMVEQLQSSHVDIEEDDEVQEDSKKRKKRGRKSTRT